MKTYYIGMSTTFHDSSIAIVNSEGKIVFAEATERYLQNKRSINMCPDVFIRIAELINEYCEPGANLVIAQTWSNESEEKVRALKNSFDKLNLDEFPYFLRRHLARDKFSSTSQLSTIKQAAKTLEYEISQMDEGAVGAIQTRKYEHHCTHAATACYTSPFEEGVCAILDGFGETRASNAFLFKNGRIQEIPGQRPESTGSLGAFYSFFVCDTCGFGQLTGEEWKVMGLAAYGEYDEEIYQLLKGIIQVDGLNVEFCARPELVEICHKLHKIRRKHGEAPITAANLAFTGQLVYSEIFFKYLNNLYELGYSENLVFSGGCALNSSANGKIIENTGFKNVHIFSAPGDDGNAIGAAMLAYYEDHPDRRPISSHQHPYLGSLMSKEAINNLVRFGKFSHIEEHPGNIHVKAAELLTQGKIIGWVQGRAEFGPRALGNRSILADPRDPDIKDKINARVKFREEFRPLAPSILEEFGSQYFENYQDSPYMERTLPFREEVKHLVPGVVHRDGTGRLQSVKKDWNPKYYQLIESFYGQTGIPLVLNTSFNVMGKPIIHTVEDAVAVFCTCGLDALIIEDYLIQH